MRTFLLSAIFSVMVSLTAFGGPPSVVLVQMHGRDNIITITRGQGKTETIALAEQRVSKNVIGNAERLYAVINGLYAEGYELKNSVSADVPGGQTIQTVTYVFVKPQ
jgi:hypothetical protein